MTAHEFPRIELDSYDGVVILTGAGVSVASGIRPYRGPDGLWNDEKLVKYSRIATFRTDPLGVWRHWWKMRELALGASPNAAHLALARAEAARPEGKRFTLVTQNVDGLHYRAGSLSLVEYHGSCMRSRCSDPGCSLRPFQDRQCSGDTAPSCPLCGAPLREQIPRAQAGAVDKALDSCDLFIAVGTSGTVWPAAKFVDAAHGLGARTIYLNLQGLGELGGSGAFDEEYLGRAEILLPLMLGPEGASGDGEPLP
ncbi:MAG: Sir2 family transcriptional regulator [Spirochaetae bacterium HGW-Spirochaetae-7]|nr:MAG: Sir2 family transcriptional regulator [Spirochaetae bacterium HGW-Spirochaetae-7]